MAYYACRMQNHKLITIAVLTLICALGSLSAQVGAQSETGPPRGDAGSDQQLVEQVEAALHGDPNISDKHITVSIKKGHIVLGGFVSDDSDRRNALRVAREAADGRKVIDNIELKQGGR